MSLLNELEEIHSYIDKEDTFFYSMVYDPNQKTLLVDKGEIRVGGDYQAEIPPYIDPGLYSRVSSINRMQNCNFLAMSSSFVIC